MEAFFDFLIRASISILCMYALYWLLLRQSTHFRANRYFLLFSLAIALLVAAFPMRYVVMISTAETHASSSLADQFQRDNVNFIQQAEENTFSILSLLPYLYAAGAIFFLLRLAIQSWKPIRIIRNTHPKRVNNCLLHENREYKMPFSFFNRILIHPEYFKQNEIDDILAHEKVHIQERHWIDLFIIELLTVLFWFNPFIWLFERAIKQNHEYLADKGVLTRGHSPVRYQAILINQLMGTQVIGLANHFNFALGPNRFKMMTKEQTPKRKLLRIAWVLPLLSILLYAFAVPEYKTENPQKQKQKGEYEMKYDNASSTQTKPDSNKRVLSVKTDKNDAKLTGKVTDENGKPLTGASVVLGGTTIGTVADKDGKYELVIPKGMDGNVFVSFVGYQTVSTTGKFKSKGDGLNINVVMKREVIEISADDLKKTGDVPPPPPPPPAPVSKDRPNFIIVEELPHYPQGFYGLAQHFKKEKGNLKEKMFFEGKKLEGKATVGFTVSKSGKVTNIQILKKSNDTAAKAAKIIASKMENWSPGSQRGKAVPVDFAMELDFE